MKSSERTQSTQSAESTEGTKWETVEGDEPIAATAIHDGHALRPEVLAISGLSDSDRLREEDPYTGAWTSVVAGPRIIVRKSRFEYDLNRQRHHAVYRVPEDAWGLPLWKREIPESLVAQSLAEYDAFYADAQRIFSAMARRHDRFIVLDFHSYNHRRGGATAAFDDPVENPEVNVGTGSLDRERWGPVIDRFIGDLTAFDFLGRQLDVRENVKFWGGNFSRWIHANFADSACCLAIEFKKFFMDEWTGEIDPREYEAISRALAAVLPGLRESLQKVDRERGKSSTSLCGVARPDGPPPSQRSARCYSSAALRSRMRRS
jgi:hypothetical protein